MSELKGSATWCNKVKNFKKPLRGRHCTAKLVRDFTFMDRKAFNFYKSYYDVAVELPDEDRNEFVWAIVSAQFTGELIEPKSKLARLMFLGQKHSIAKQLEGFKASNKLPPEAPPEGGWQAPHEGPNRQVQGQEKGQEKVKEQGEKRTQFILGKPNDTKYFLIVPKSPISPIYRINGEDGMSELFELNQSIIKNRSAVNTFLLNNSGAHFNEFSHVYNKFNLHIEQNTQAYGR